MDESQVLPVASSEVKSALDEQLDFGENVIDATIREGAKINEFMGAATVRWMN